MSARLVRWLLLAIVLALAVPSQHAAACSVPVFRFAAERWLPDLYEVVLFHKGPLTDGHKALLKRLEDAALPNHGCAPFEVVTVDVAKTKGGALLDLWKMQKGAEMPWLVLRTPSRQSRDPEPIWSAALSEQAVDTLLFSQARHEIAEAICGGDSAVWVLLECGDKARDAAAFALLRTQLRKLEKSLKLPVLRDNHPEDRIERGPNAPDLRIGFSLIRLSRTDASEAPLVQMLLRCQDDLQELDKEPIAFPVFGRGRALQALVGKEIDAGDIEDACTFVIGPCGCEVKRQNPGSDLLITADWDRTFRPGRGMQTDAPKAAPTVAKPASSAPAPALPATVAQPESDSNLVPVFAVLVAVLVGSAAIACTMTRWKRA